MSDEKGKKFVKYGGIKFTNNVSPTEINRYVQDLPNSERQSLFQVIKHLDKDGLITLDDSEISTIDDETQEWQD